jgi:putative phosphoesterase
MPGSIEALWPQVYDAFANVDCILHAGDLHVSSVIDELETLAPTYVCYGNGDLGVEHPKLQDSWFGSLAGVGVGLVHKFPTPRRADESVIYGHTHLAEVHAVAGRVYINPGSPTLPDNQSTRHGTVGFLEISAAGLAVELHQIHDGGLSLIEGYSHS